MRSLRSISPVVLIVGGVIGGILFWGAFNTAIEQSNRLEFCISCHEMESNAYREYQKTIHYKNRTGVRVICSDCHVPREWIHKVIRKIQATSDLYHKIIGSVDTKEKFEAKRLEMAERVWASMEATDSRECRNCHSFDVMDMEKQGRRSREKHPEAIEAGDTCIDCHKGIAHKMPVDEDDD